VRRGACAGIGVDFYQWGKESGKIAALIIQGKKAAQISIQPLKKKVLYLNLKSAEVQGVHFPPDLIQKADQVIR
jgi:putative ABC transport system substrate-binding protein